MKIINQVGLEAEFILRDSKGKIRFPAKHGFLHDDFYLLGEFRAEPGATRQQAVGNYMAALAEVLYLAEKKELTVDVTGVYEISPEVKADVLRKMASKNVPETKNIYGTDILTLSDDVVENGQIKVSRISAGLHVHFSRWVQHDWKDKNDLSRSDWANIITPSARKSIIVAMDKDILPKYDLGVPLKYRKPGFYEEKPWGFEYRSLPMVEEFSRLEGVMALVDYAFTQLERLAK